MEILDYVCPKKIKFFGLASHLSNLQMPNFEILLFQTT